MRNNSKSIHKSASGTSSTGATPLPEKIKRLLDKNKLTAEEIFFLEVEYFTEYYNNDIGIFSASQRQKIHKRILNTTEEIKKVDALLGPSGLLPTAIKMLTITKQHFTEAESFLKTLMLFQDELRIKNKVSELLKKILQKPSDILTNLPKSLQLPTATLKKKSVDELVDILLIDIDFPLAKIMEDVKEKTFPQSVLKKVNSHLRLATVYAETCRLFAEKINKKELLNEAMEAKKMFEQMMVFFYSTVPTLGAEAQGITWLQEWKKKGDKPLSDFIDLFSPHDKAPPEEFVASWPSKARLEKAKQYAKQCELWELDLAKILKVLGA